MVVDGRSMVSHTKAETEQHDWQKDLQRHEKYACEVGHWLELCD